MTAMPRAFPLTFLLAAAAALGCAPARTESRPARLQAGAITLETVRVEDRLRADVAWLASRELGGRRAGTEDADAAASWLAFQLRSLGLEGAGDGADAFTQEFNLPAARVLAEDAPLRKPLTCADFGVPASVDAARCFPTLASAAGTVTGVLAELADDVNVDKERWDSKEPKIAVARLVKGDAEGGAGEANPHALPPSLRSFAFRARQRGATGLVVAIDGAGQAVEASGEDRDVGLPAIYVLTSALPSRDAWGARWVLDPAVVRVPRRTKNVLGRVPASSPNASVLVVGAHYDHLGRGGADSLAPGTTAIHHGADDNASGTAVVLELARRFAPRKGTMKRELVFAFWGAEEMGLLGSKHWIQHPTIPLERVAANVNFDMVGRSRERKLDVGGVASSAGWKEMMAEANRSLAAPLQLRTSTKLTGIGGSDHMSFQDVKRPALFFFTGLHEDYHKPGDTPEKLEYGTMAAIADLAEATILALDKRDDVQWIEPPAESAPAATGAEAGLRAWLGTIPDYGADDGGVVLSGASAGSPAAKAGLQAKDVVKRVGEYKIDNVYDLTEALSKLKPGDEVELVYVRGGETRTVKIQLAARRR
jgi:hypothetical protein